MAYQATFKRYEIKYLLTQQQKQDVLQAMQPYMKLDQYGRTTIRNVYYDTDTYRLIRRSLEKPAYKEKLRVRSYQTAAPDTPVFVELKKKYKSVVYKRRLTLPEIEARNSFNNGSPLPLHSQIAEEIEYFRSYYEGLRPTVFLSYEREAFYAADCPDFRVTFDSAVLCRRIGLSLRSEAYGTPLLPEGTSLMELKCAGAVPLWMARVLSKERIYQTAFSKYGTAYRTVIYPDLGKEALRHA